MDGRNRNNLTVGQRSAAARKQRRKRKAGDAKRGQRSRLEAAKNVLRRTGVEVYNAGIDDPRLKGFIRVGVRKHTEAEVLKMAADVLHHEATRQKELRALYGLPAKRSK
jgi:hypothetical protein